jgi:hypothetical protein
MLEARKIWYGLEALYGNNAELAPLIGQARSRLQDAKAAGGDTPASDVGKQPID